MEELSIAALQKEYLQMQRDEKCRSNNHQNEYNDPNIDPERNLDNSKSMYETGEVSDVLKSIQKSNIDKGYKSAVDLNS